jgi:hypothetical protein
MQRPGRAVTGAALAFSAVVLLGACNGGGGGNKDGFVSNIRGEDGSESSVNMRDPKVPKDFPSNEVPLPRDGKLRAVVRGTSRPNRFYTFTYSLKGQSGLAIGADYRQQLERANFSIRKYQRTGGSDGGFVTFEAIGRRWDISVVSGKGTLLETPSLSIQVNTHGTLSGTPDEIDILDNERLLDVDDLDDIDNPDDADAETPTDTIPLDGE